MNRPRFYITLQIVFVLMLSGLSCKGKNASDDYKELVRSASSFYDQKKYLDAYKAYNQLLKIDTSNGEFYFKRGRCEAEVNNYDVARVDFLEAIKHNYKKASSYYNIALTYLFVNDSLTRKYITECLREDPNHVKAIKVLIRLNYDAANKVKK